MILIIFIQERLSEMGAWKRKEIRKGKEKKGIDAVNSSSRGVGLSIAVIVNGHGKNVKDFE
jgi:hypothetical protein